MYTHTSEYAHMLIILMLAVCKTNSSGVGTNFGLGGGKVYWEGWTKTTLYNNHHQHDIV